ncbi:MAG TPA: Ku protein [Solirubrobacteraceae bacterium]|jgi:DNA end-binding protein Ku|nr:Ku protein [Solirubrobacteraceae bacterium]
MPRPLWSGSLSFGLVNVPVALFSAVRDMDVHFNQLHAHDASPIETRRVCSAGGQEVPWDQIAKGYELEDGRWVLLSDEELAAAAPHKSQTIDVECFVRESEIDPVYYDRPYVLSPRDEAAARAYGLLGEAMAKSGRVALGRFVMHAKEHLVSIRPRGAVLTLTTVRFAEEVRSREEIAEAVSVGVEPSGEEIENAAAIIAELEVSFDPSRYKDEHRAHLQRIIKRKQKGQKIVAPKIEEERGPVASSAPDLMGALQESLARIRGEAGGGGSGKKKPARRKAATNGAGAGTKAPGESKSRQPSKPRR